MAPDASHPQTTCLDAGRIARKHGMHSKSMIALAFICQQKQSAAYCRSPSRDRAGYGVLPGQDAAQR
ncbi:hypothetical protein ACKKBF_B40705 [Auxenochlorella protothecoides x Auxenochlorella symbiontica]